MHLAPLIRDLAVILGVAAVVTLVFQRIRQPVVLGYIIAGALVGARITDQPNIKTWAELGVIFLMFSLGLEFSFRKLAKVGISSGFTALFEVSVMILTGFGLGRLMRWSPMESLFLGAILAISSTTIIIKALDELKLKTRRFAEMIFGVLVVEDLVAVLILVALSTVAVSAKFSGLALLLSAGKLVLVIGSWFLVGYFLLPRVVRYVGRLGNDEMLTIVALGLCLILAVAAAELHYSVALGAFIMGSILAESTESHRIEELIRPLRDVFAAIFFVSVGMMIEPRVLLEHWPRVLLISGVYVLVKISAVTLGAVLSGQTLRTAVQVGFGVAQIGEFSFIIATLGQNLGVTRDELFPIAVAVSLITTFMTPYLIRVSHKFAVGLEGRLPLPLKEGLVRYAAWSQERRADRAKRLQFYQLLGKWALNGILVSVIYILVAELLMPEAVRMFRPRRLAVAGSWLAASLLAAPFLWAMFSAFHAFGMSSQEEVRAADALGGLEGGGESPMMLPRGGVLFVMRLITGFWIGALSLEYFSAKSTLFLMLGFMIALFGLFYRQIDASYRWFEARFLSTFETRPKSRKTTDVLKHLAPWDAHLVRIKVHPNAEIAGLRIREAALRKRYGFNIVAIQRGIKSLISPGPDEFIFPKDELLVLGTDEQIEAVRFSIEKPPGLGERFRDLEGYELRQIRLETCSGYCGKTLAEARIGGELGVTIVGLEKGERRLINPESTVRLDAGDVLWVVGETERLEQLTQRIEPPIANTAD